MTKFSHFCWIRPDFFLAKIRSDRLKVTPYFSCFDEPRFSVRWAEVMTKEAERISGSELKRQTCGRRQANWSDLHFIDGEVGEKPKKTPNN